MQPELDQQRVLISEHALELDDTVKDSVQLAARDALEDTIEEWPRLPGTEEDAGAAGRRQQPPVAPHRRVLPFLVGLLHHGVRLDAASVQPGQEQVDRLRLAGALDAGDRND